MTTLQIADGHLLDAVKKLELARYAAMVRGDLDALAALLADDLTYHHSNAHADTKASWLASLRTGQTRFLAIEPGELQARVAGARGAGDTRTGATVILTGTLTVLVLVDGQEQRNPLRFTDVWTDRGPDANGSPVWQMVAWQSTRLP